MRKVFALIVGLLGFAGAAEAAPGNGSALKRAFEQSRAERNIDLVLPVLERTRLYVVARSVQPPGSTKDLFLTPSPTPGRYCVTVAADLAHLAKIDWPKTEVTGAQLLAGLPEDVEIVVVWGDGGDHVTREQRQWWREQASQ